MRNKNAWLKLLVWCCIILLVALQFLWIRSIYEKAYFDLRRDVNMVFRTTVTNFRNAALTKNMVPVDSFRRNGFIKTEMITDSTFTVQRNIRRKKSLQVYIESRTGGEISKSAISIKDSIVQTIEAPTFLIRLETDTLNRDSIGFQFKQGLPEELQGARFAIEYSRTEIPDERFVAPFHEVHERHRDSPNHEVSINPIFSDSIYTDPVRVTPFHRYQAKVFGVQQVVMKEIAPQLIFSVVLTAMIITAFFFMYRSIRTQQKLMEMKNDLISNISHELKTPVATVSVALEALRNFSALDDKERTNDYLHLAQNELSRLSLITDKILKTALFEAKDLELTFQQVDMRKTLTEVVASLRVLLEKEQISLEQQCDGSDFIVEGNESHLTNVVFNLTENAIKYSKTGGVIITRLLADEMNIILEITDNGIGIPNEYHKRIFEKFFRVPAGDVHNIKGYGLGLSYVADVVKLHRGHINVVSEPGKGSTFKVTIPRKHES